MKTLAVKKVKLIILVVPIFVQACHMDKNSSASSDRHRRNKYEPFLYYVQIVLRYANKYTIFTKAHPQCCTSTTVLLLV